jgi:O-antigen/teichoic acid export membrane protein
MEELDVITLGKKSVQGVVALISRTFILQIVQTVASLLILSILVPSDVGVYTAVIALQRIISFFTDFGLGAALIQKKEALTHNDLKTSFTLQAGITFLILLAVITFRDPISAYFKLGEQGEGLLVALVATIFISSFKTIPSILLERKIRFEKLIIPQIIESLVFNILLIVLILRGFRLESYTVAFLASSLVTIPVYYYISPWRIGLGIDRESLRHLKFGVQFQAKNILATTKDDLLTVLLTKLLTFTEIGYIGFGQRIAFMAYRFVVDSVTKVTFSAYSRIQGDHVILKKAIEKSLFFVSSLMFPVLAGIILTIPYIIEYFVRWHKWEPAIFSLTFFCLNAAVSSLSGILVNVLDASGRVKTTLNLMVIWTALTWTLTPLLIFSMGYNGVALASFIVTLTIIYTVYLIKQKIQFEFMKNIYKPLLCTVIMTIIVFAGTKLFVRNIETLCVIIAVGGISYCLCYFFMAKKELFEMKRFIFKKHA